MQRALRAVALVALVAGGFVAAGIADTATWLQPQAPSAAGLALLAAMIVVGSLAFVPRTLMAIGAGYAFGLWVAPVVLVAACCGASLAFAISRALAQDLVRGVIERRPRQAAVIAALEDEGWRLVAAARIGAPVPSSAMSYLFGATRIRHRTFAIGSCVGMMPTVALYVAVGASGQTALEGAAGLAPLISLALAVAALAVITVLVRRRLKVRLAAPAAPALA